MLHSSSPAECIWLLGQLFFCGKKRGREDGAEKKKNFGYDSNDI